MNEHHAVLSNAVPAEYHSYMLRLWRPHGGDDWRLMVVAVHSGKKQVLPDLAALLDFLRAELAAPATARSAGAPRHEHAGP